MDAKSWIKTEKAIRKSKKSYAHFDYRTDIAQKADYILNPEKIISHGFYPFIHYVKDMTKYNGKELKPKSRDICYAAHIDRCIYQYYSFVLNELYNERVARDGLSNVAVAYRTDLHVSNIELAKRAIDFIRGNSPCYVMIGDFTHFFDELDHNYLKKQWCSLLNVSTLPDDHYKIYRSITKFRTVELTDLLAIHNLKDTEAGRKKLNSFSKVLTTEQFKANKSLITTNKKGKGIPQGSPISALLANVYMLDIDKLVHDKIAALSGLYMRYSDDFIIVLPGLTEKIAIETLQEIRNLINQTDGLTLEPSKTQYFYCDGAAVTNCGEEFHSEADCGKKAVNFLGFTFDGEKVSIRSKTTSKYYYRMYRKGDAISRNGGVSPKGNKISCKNLYMKYSERGAHSKKGNFLSYVGRSEKVFGTHETIGRDTKRHMQKIRRAISGKRHSQIAKRRAKRSQIKT